jgi:hypothetical protein
LYQQLIMFACIYCDKPHAKKTDKFAHESVCCLIQITRPILADVTVDEVPSQLQMYKAMTELAMRCAKLEEKVAKHHAHIARQQAKVDFIAWLNDRKCVPTKRFREMMDDVAVHSLDAENLFSNSYLKTLIAIFERELPVSITSPITAFSQKAHCVYVYDFPTEIDQGRNQDQTQIGWRLLGISEFTRLLNMVQKKLITELTKWKCATASTIPSTRVEELYNKAIMKIMETEFNEQTIKKIINQVYAIIKTNAVITVMSNNHG